MRLAGALARVFRGVDTRGVCVKSQYFVYRFGEIEPWLRGEQRLEQLIELGLGEPSQMGRR